MIISFGTKDTEKIWNGIAVKNQQLKSRKLEEEN